MAVGKTRSRQSGGGRRTPTDRSHRGGCMRFEGYSSRRWIESCNRPTSNTCRSQRIAGHARSAFNRGPERIVVRVSIAVHLIDIAECTGWMRRGALRRQNGAGGQECWEGTSRTINAIRNQGLIDVLIQLKVSGLQSNVSDIQAYAGSELALNRQVPVL